MADRNTGDLSPARRNSGGNPGSKAARSGDAVIAEVVRSGFVESRHHGSVVTLEADGSVGRAIGDGGAPMFPRSCNKPIQAVAMLRNGLEIRDELIALACGSHSAETFQLAGVRELLNMAGLSESALQTPPAHPPNQCTRKGFQGAGSPPAPVLMGCSGKHAVMLLTCTLAGWSTADYLDPVHPLQRRIRQEVERMTGEPVTATGVDGCGAPLYATSLTGLARAYRRLVLALPGTPERLVADAIAGNPEWVSGSRRWEARLLRGLPHAVGKSGAEGCYALALHDGRSLALKIADGADRALPVVVATLLHRMLPGWTPPSVDSHSAANSLEAAHAELRPTAVIESLVSRPRRSEDDNQPAWAPR